MNDLTLMLIKLAFLAVLWLFILMAVGVIRTDLFGGPAKKSRPARGAEAAVSAKPTRGRRGGKEPRALVVTQGPLTGTTLDLTSQPIVIGRARDATLVISDDYASGHHARIYPENGRWIVEDLNSTNGTYLGKQRLTRKTALSVGQPIRIGKTVLELRK
jgi:pSer/pThr/pTyr-binding forkhead associated (FHA) protein